MPPNPTHGAATTILGIWAHPDDEVFVSGGLMADAVRHGDRVECIHMTHGEGGLFYRQQSSPEMLAGVRQRELKTSLARLGIREQRFLDYPDGCLDEIPGDEGIVRIYRELTRVEPDVIVTFGPDGFTGHPDHRTLSAWVTAAFALWNNPGARLYHTVISSEWKDSFVPALNEFDFFWPGYPIPDVADVSLKLDEEVLTAKVEALGAHASQMQPLFRAYGENFMRTVVSEEHFRLVAEYSVLPTSSSPAGATRSEFDEVG